MKVDQRFALLYLTVWLVCIVHFVAGNVCQKQTNFGRSFTLAFPRQYGQRTDGVIELQISAQVSGSVTLVCSVGKTSTVLTSVSSSRITKLYPNTGNRLTVVGRSNRGCTLASDVDIAVYVIDTLEDGRLSVDGFMALPDNVLSSDYVVSSYDAATGRESTASSDVVITCPTICNVSLTFPHAFTYNGSTYGPPNQLIISLNRTSILIADNNDLSGTRVHSDNPVAVYGSNKCAEVPHGYDACDFMVEQMIPVQDWGTHYVVTGIPPRAMTVVRVYAKEPATTCTLYKQHGTPVHIIIDNSTGFIEFQVINIVDTPLEIFSSTPVAVMQYGVGSHVDSSKGGPFMASVPSTDQMVSHYKAVFDTTTGHYSYKTLAIVALTSQIHDLTYTDGTPILQTNSVHTPLMNYSVIYINIIQGQGYSIGSKSGETKLSALLYSGDSQYGEYSYGFPLLMSFSRQEGQCTSTTVTSSTTASSTTSSTTTSSTTTSSTTTSSTTTSSTTTSSTTTSSTTTSSTTTVAITTAAPITTANVPPLTCFSCNDASHLKYCNALSICNHGEVCYASSYTTVDGHRKYRSGCIRKSACSHKMKRETPDVAQRDLSAPCLTCCSADFCNSEGCGDPGFPAQDNRGPLCFDCGHVGNISECTEVTLCKRTERCSVSEYSWGDADRTYTMGCTDEITCATSIGKRSIDVQQVRSVPICQSCCTGDFCNRHCTSGNVGPGLIG